MASPEETAQPAGGSPRAELSRAEVWASVRIGERLGPIEWRADDRTVAARLSSIGFGGNATGAAVDGRARLPAPLFLDAYYALMDLRYDWPLAIAAKTEIEAFAAAPADATYTCDLEIVDKYERRGGRYVVTMTWARDPGRRLVCALRNTALTNPADVLRR